MVFEQVIKEILLSSGCFLAACILFVLVYMGMILIKQAYYYRILNLYQQWISCLISIVVFSLFPIRWGLVVWFVSFFPLRLWLFKNIERRLLQIDTDYKNSLSPRVERISQWRAPFVYPTSAEIYSKDFRYGFVDHLNSLLVLTVLCLLGIVAPCKETIILYSIEFLIVATAFFVFVGKISYFLSYESRRSPFCMCPRLSYISVVFTGILYYFVVGVMLKTISDSMTF